MGLIRPIGLIGPIGLMGPIEPIRPNGLMGLCGIDGANGGVLIKGVSSFLWENNFWENLVGWRIIRTFASRLYPNLTIRGNRGTFGRV